MGVPLDFHDFSPSEVSKKAAFRKQVCTKKVQFELDHPLASFLFMLLYRYPKVHQRDVVGA